MGNNKDKSKLKGLAALAAEGAALRKKKETQNGVVNKKDQYQYTNTSRLGPLDLEKYLTHYGIAFEKKPRKTGDDRNIYKISCLFNSILTALKPRG